MINQQTSTSVQQHSMTELMTLFREATDAAYAYEMARRQSIAKANHIKHAMRRHAPKL